SSLPPRITATCTLSLHDALPISREKAAVVKKLAQFTGLSEDYISKANLRVNLPQFREELQRSRGRTTGRLDARFSGPSYDPLAAYAGYDPQSTAVSWAFTSALNTSMLGVLLF